MNNNEDNNEVNNNMYDNNEDEHGENQKLIKQLLQKFLGSGGIFLIEKISNKKI